MVEKKQDGRRNNGGHSTAGRKKAPNKMKTYTVRLTAEQAKYTMAGRGKFIRNLIQKEMDSE